MKKLILSLILTLSLVFGFNSVNAAEVSNNKASSIKKLDGLIFIRVYEEGSFWIYIYTLDGIFLSKHIEN